jgi:hypothetical protein
MASNKFQWHLRIFVEDDANRQIVNGFLESFFQRNIPRYIRVLPPSGGWGITLKRAQQDCAEGGSCRRVLAVIDFDGDADRIRAVSTKGQANFYVMGCREEPEKLRQLLQHPGHFSTLGDSLAREYCDNNTSLWPHIVNKEALDSLMQDAKDQHIC